MSELTLQDKKVFTIDFTRKYVLSHVNNCLIKQ